MALDRNRKILLGGVHAAAGLAAAYGLLYTVGFVTTLITGDGTLLGPLGLIAGIVSWPIAIWAERSRNSLLDEWSGQSLEGPIN